MSTELAVVDADFKPLTTVVEFTATDAVRTHEQIQAFFSAVIGSDARNYDIINGKREPKAMALMKLWSPLGCSSKIISKNEHGEYGVRRDVIEDVNGKRDIRFSCTMIVSSTRLGSAIEVTASQYMSEKRGVPESYVEAQAQTRARKRALRILSGFDSEDASEDRAAERARRDAQSTLDGKTIMARAVTAGYCPPDKAAFLDWARERVPGCADMQTLRVPHAQAIAKFLDEQEVA